MSWRIVDKRARALAGVIEPYTVRDGNGKRGMEVMEGSTTLVTSVKSYRNEAIHLLSVCFHSSSVLSHYTSSRYREQTIVNEATTEHAPRRMSEDGLSINKYYE